MGCVSSSFLDQDEPRIVRPNALSHHIVSLTSSTYGLLSTLEEDPSSFSVERPTSVEKPTSVAPPVPPPMPPARTHLPVKKIEPEVINSWELMAGLDPNTPGNKTRTLSSSSPAGKENNVKKCIQFNSPMAPPKRVNVLKELNGVKRSLHVRCLMESFERRCPPGGSHALVLYTTSLRGIRKTFEECNEVRAILEGLGFWVKERDVSMDLGFREELRDLMKGSTEGPTVPRLFIKGRHIGGAKIVLKLHEEGILSELLQGLPKSQFNGGICDGCGGLRFLPCFQCNGSRKIVVPMSGELKKKGGVKAMVLKCVDCNENGLVLCPICS